MLGVDVALFLLIGLLGGAHCIGMCGPLVTIYAQRMTETRPDGGTATGKRRDASFLTTYEVRQHLLFNIGRAVSYATIGSVMGALGAVVFLSTAEITTAATSVRGVVGIAIGAVVIGIGVRYLLGEVSVGVGLPDTQRVTDRLTGLVDRLAGGPGIMALGALHGLLPCPILYPAYLYAFTTGSPLAGGIALGALGLGTIPAVFAYGTVIDQVTATNRRRLHQVLGLAFIALGYVLFAHGLMAIGIQIPHPSLPFWNPLGGAH